jgi:hypothetical protein
VNAGAEAVVTMAVEDGAGDLWSSIALITSGVRFCM